MKFVTQAVIITSLWSLPLLGWASKGPDKDSKPKPEAEDSNAPSGPKESKPSNEPKEPNPPGGSKEDSFARLNWSIRYDQKNEMPWVYQYRWNGLGNDLDFDKVEEFLRSFPKEFKVINASDWEKYDHSDKDKNDNGNSEDRGKGDDANETKSWVFTFRSSYAPNWRERDSDDRESWKGGVTYDFSKYLSGPFNQDQWHDPKYGGKGIFETIQYAWPRDYQVPIPGLSEPVPPANIAVPEASAGFGLATLVGAAAYAAHRRRRARSAMTSTDL